MIQYITRARGLWGLRYSRIFLVQLFFFLNLVHLDTPNSQAHKLEFILGEIESGYALYSLSTAGMCRGGGGELVFVFLAKWAQGTIGENNRGEQKGHCDSGLNSPSPRGGPTLPARPCFRLG